MMVRQHMCKMAFIIIHGINEGRIQQHNRKRTSTGVTTDQRGKNTFNNRVTAEQIQLVHTHIQLILAKRTHYTIYIEILTNNTWTRLIN